MADYLSRGQAPLSPEQWDLLDRSVVTAAKRQLVGRRFIPIYGPVGPGTQAILEEVFEGAKPAHISLVAGDEQDAVRPSDRRFRPLPVIYTDFVLNWRDLETSQQYGLPVDFGAAQSAAVYCAQAEDNLIFNGNANLGLPGLLNAESRTTIPMSNWGEGNGAFQDVVAAVSALTGAGFAGPYAVVTSPGLYANMNRIFQNTGILEIDQIRGLATDGVFQSAVLPEPTAIVVAPGAQNMDLVLAQDLTTAFLENRGMSYFFRVFEVVGLRVKRPDAICSIEGGAPQAGERRRGRRRPEEFS